MALNISTKMRDVIAGAVDIFNSGSLEIRSGAAPGPNAADSGTLLADITLPADAFGAVASGVISKAGTWEDTSADGTGTAAHWRMKQSGDTGGATGATDERLEGTAGTSGTDMILDNDSIATGQTVTVTAFSITSPAS